MVQCLGRRGVPALGGDTASIAARAPSGMSQAYDDTEDGLRFIARRAASGKAMAQRLQLRID